MNRNIMKLMNNSARLIILQVLAGIALGFSACSSGGDEKEIIPKTIEQYKSEMILFVTSEKAIVENCIVGYNKGDFKSLTTFDTYKAAYLAVLVAAQASLGRENITIPELVEVNRSLSAPGKAFTGSLWISDRRPLNDAIVAAEELNMATTEGTGKGQAPAAAKTAFASAIAAAKTVRGAGTTIERQVTEAVEKLNEAKQAFLTTIIK